MLPLIGRIADLRGRVPVLVAALVLFAAGLAGHRRWPTTCRAWSPAGSSRGSAAAGWCPATLALVADLYPAERRGVPLGIVSAVQELGSVAGPLFGAVVLAVADWRAIFAINLAVGLVLAAAIRALRHGRRRPASTPGRAGTPRSRAGPARGCCCCSLTLAAGGLVFVRPASLLRDLTWGQLFIPYAGDGRWLTPVGTVAVVAAVLFLVRTPDRRDGRWSTCATGAAAARDADLTGALLLAVALGGVILAFATADPEVQVFSDQGLWYLLGSAAGRRWPSCCTCAAPRRRWCRAARCGVPRPGGRSW